MSASSNDSTRYHTLDVPVRGGDLRVGVWEPEQAPMNGSAAPTILAIHGVTASHRCWRLLAEALPEWRVVAPDLRGRGRSKDLPPPFGMPQHAQDAVAALDHVGVDRAVVVGHSMGGFVSVALNYRHSERVSALILVDGGVQLFIPEGVTIPEAISATLGPSLQRLSMTFPDREAYRAFFRAHPSFVDNWTDAVVDYVDYDLVGDPPAMRPATTTDAVELDTEDFISGGQWLLPALDAIPDPTPFLRAPRYLIDQDPGLYPPEWIMAWQERLPALDVREVPDVNHYTIVLGDAGVAAIAETVRATG